MVILHPIASAIRFRSCKYFFQFGRCFQAGENSPQSHAGCCYRGGYYVLKSIFQRSGAFPCHYQAAMTQALSIICSFWINSVCGAIYRNTNISYLTLQAELSLEGHFV
jgi:hypothetical protein